MHILIYPAILRDCQNDYAMLLFYMVELKLLILINCADQGKQNGLTSISTSDKVTLYLELAEVHRLCDQQVIVS